MYKKNLKFLVMSKDMAKSLVAAALTVAFSTPVAANTATGSHTASVAFSKQADGIVMPTDADGSNNLSAIQGVKGLEDLVGKTEDEIKKAALEPNEGLSDADPTKVFFLYNVKTGKFLNAGGYWGTHVSLKDYPLSLWAEKNTYNFFYGTFPYTSQTLIDFKQNMETGQGKYLGWMDGATDPDDGVFIDRLQDENTHYGWVFEPLKNDTQNTYKIYTYATKKPYSTLIAKSTKYYLCANGDETDQDKNCGAFKDSYIQEEKLEDYSTWRVLSMQQIYDLITEQSSDNMTSALDLSYRLDCPGFSRGDKDITVWNVSNFATGTNGGWRFGLEKLYNTQKKLTGSGKLDNYDVTDLKSSYTFDGREYKNKKEDYERHLGKYFCADAKNLRGVIYQDVVIKAPGSYIIECKGYSTTPKAKIFATWLDKEGEEDNAFLHQNVLNQVSYMSKAEQAELHVNEQNMDYAGKNFYGKRKYINTVLVQVPDTKPSDGNYGTIRFGLIIGDNRDDQTVNEADKEWTVFDDFRLLYASDEKSADLILDEDRDNLSYLKDCDNTYKNTVLHLNKTFTKDKWNSFVLPVSLKRDQFRQAFGANARLAKLHALTSSEIQFQTVDMDAKTMTDNAVVLDAYTPYIIFPTKIHTDNTEASPAYKASLTKRNGESTPVVIKANHYDIPNVTFKTNNEIKNDLSQMDTQKWVSNVTKQVGGTDGSMVAYGTFARTFGTRASQDADGVYKFDDRDIISGRDDLKGSYFFDKGNLYYSSKRVRGLRGFSCWFKPVNSPAPTKLNLYIDGVANGTTGIDEVAFGDEEPTGKAAKGIYNMNGQLVSNGSDTTNLPAGMYIVNGKKCVVR
ncbi:MAG: T9SS type A sorting domain-containing protein [Prevotella sp.]|nr:T9SS type A sorting domain-containing protein [Prevotella sp.]